jgi:hypothetical protein
MQMGEFVACGVELAAQVRDNSIDAGVLRQQLLVIVMDDEQCGGARRQADGGQPAPDALIDKVDVQPQPPIMGRLDRLIDG